MGEARLLRIVIGPIRPEILERDKGVCFICGCDCLEFEIYLSSFDKEKQQKIAYEYFGKEAYKRKTFWDADHIIEIQDGGKTCDLSNYQTLCLCCHREKTIKRLRENKRTNK